MEHLLTMDILYQSGFKLILVIALLQTPLLLKLTVVYSSLWILSLFILILLQLQGFTIKQEVLHFQWQVKLLLFQWANGLIYKQVLQSTKDM